MTVFENLREMLDDAKKLERQFRERGEMERAEFYRRQAEQHEAELANYA